MSTERNVERDVELGAEDYKTFDDHTAEEQALLPGSSSSKDEHQSYPEALQQTLSGNRGGLLSSNFDPKSKPRFTLLYLTVAFVGGILSCLLAQYFLRGRCFSNDSTTDGGALIESPHVLAPPYVGSTERHHYPPTSPTNAFPTLFPSDVGYPGSTPTGAEPAVIATAPYYPMHTGASQLVIPSSMFKSEANGKKFNLLRYWGNLSPWYSVERGAFGLNSSAEAPEGCSVTGLHLLHRHGARYPTAYASYGGPAQFAGRLHESAAGWNGSGQLDFMNGWTYKLGEEVLTPFGRQQLFDLGVSMRLKYGFLLENFTATNTLPVFRTESQDRMLHSALNFAIGFFGYPHEDKYQQSITIEASGFNNTLAPYMTCPNAGDGSKSDRGRKYVSDWADIYLKDARARLGPQLKGYDLTIPDVYTFQQLCAYETVAIGYSKFCELFTEEEWAGFEYSLDLYFWYNTAFGAPLARGLGIGYVQELIARLTHTPIATHNSSTNGTLDDNTVTFPLDQSLYVDATHEVVVSYIITALNLTNFATSGPLPSDHIPANHQFVASQLLPFSTNVQFQLLSCSSEPDPQIRIVINDGVVPLTGVKGCPAQKDGMCPIDVFIEAEKEMIRDTDWEYVCHGDWEVPPGSQWETMTGYPPL